MAKAMHNQAWLMFYIYLNLTFNRTLWSKSFLHCSSANGFLAPYEKCGGCISIFYINSLQKTEEGKTLTKNA